MEFASEILLHSSAINGEVSKHINRKSFIVFGISNSNYKVTEILFYLVLFIRNMMAPAKASKANAQKIPSKDVSTDREGLENVCWLGVG